MLLYKPDESESSGKMYLEVLHGLVLTEINYYSNVRH